MRAMGLKGFAETEDAETRKAEPLGWLNVPVVRVQGFLDGYE
jgi:hypothetical protein